MLHLSPPHPDPPGHRFWGGTWVVDLGSPLCVQCPEAFEQRAQGKRKKSVWLCLCSHRYSAAAEAAVTQNYYVIVSVSVHGFLDLRMWGGQVTLVSTYYPPADLPASPHQNHMVSCELGADILILLGETWGGQITFIKSFIQLNLV